MLTRETIIALRARHQAHRIASDFLYPHIEQPPVAQPVSGELDPNRPVEPEVSSRPMIVLAVVIWVWVIIAFLLQWALPSGK